MTRPPRSRQAQGRPAQGRQTQGRAAANQRPPDPFNPARELAVRVLLRVLNDDVFAAPALDAALQDAQLPARDAGLATHIVYGTLRHHASLQAALTPMLQGETHPKTRALLLAGAFEKLHLGTPAHAVVSEYVNVARGARLAPAGLVNAVLRRVELPAEHIKELPDWLVDVYRRAYGDQANAIFDDLLQPQPLWLSLSESGAASLEAEGSAVLPGPLGVDRVELSRPLRETQAFQGGQAQPINPASLACVEALGDVNRQRVLDLAGGAGVKAAMLAARGAQVVSVDLMPRKHKLAQKNLQRLGLGAQFITHDLTQPLDAPPAPFVLLDAPCTGSGTLRSHPEIKLRLTPDTVNQMAALQAQMLPNAAAVVQPGGVLVYSVCSVTPQEGQEVISQFLDQHREFTPEDIQLPDLPHVKADHGILITPTSGIDGFFIARMRRKA